MIEFKVAVMDFANRVSILACSRDAYGQIRQIAAPVEWTMKEHPPGDYIAQGSLEMDYKAAQSLINALWDAGLRPTDFKSSSGEINRMEAHLADMRKLVFDRTT